MYCLIFIIHIQINFCGSVKDLFYRLYWGRYEVKDSLSLNIIGNYKCVP